MAFGDILGNVVLGGSNKRVYTPDEQAAYSAKYPGIVWRDGVPYTESAITPAGGTDYAGDNPQYSGLTGREDQPGALTEADLSDPNFLAQLGRFAAVTSAAHGPGAGWGTGGAPGTGGTSAAVGSGGAGGGAGIGGAGTQIGLSAPGGAAGGGGAAMGTTGFLGTLAKYGKTAQNLSSVLGGAAGASADAQQTNATLQNQQNQLANQQFSTQQNAQMQGGQLDLDRQKFQAQQMKRALVAALLGNMQDVNVTVPGITNATVTGGARPSALNKDILALIQQQGLQTGQSPTWTGGELLTPPTLAPVGKTGGNSFLNALALASSLYGGATAGQQAKQSGPGK